MYLARSLAQVLQEGLRQQLEKASVSLVLVSLFLVNHVVTAIKEATECLAVKA